MNKLRQIWNDHKAMQIFRDHNGDVHLTSFVGGAYRTGYECRIFQHEWHVEDHDPAVAILKAFDRWKTWKTSPPTPTETKESVRKLAEKQQRNE